MATIIDYALLAGASYYDTRAALNRFPVPANWSVYSRVPEDKSTGFEASAYKNELTNEIVISYAGTYDKDYLGDIAADAALAVGYGSAQLVQAAQYYLDIVRSNNTNATITLTGHSLGGGLAALVGVFFGVETHTFDQAPFANTAQSNSLWTNPLNIFTPDVAANLKTTLLSQGYTQDELAPLSIYIDLRHDYGGIPNSDLVTNINVRGEFLSSAPATTYDRIGTEEFIENNASVAGGDLHAQSLLAAFLQSQKTATTGTSGQVQSLNEVTFKLTDLLKMIFDEKLFAHPVDISNTEFENFLEYLVRHESGVQDSIAADEMVTRFTKDLWKIAQDSGMTMSNSKLTDALIAFAMQMYYEDTSTDASNISKELFEKITGGIKFDMADVSTKFKAAFDANQKLDLKDAKGYDLYFKQYLSSQDSGLNVTERSFINSLLPYIRDWYIQAGASAMVATATQQHTSLMLGGTGADNLTGSNKEDLLIGNAGNDTLKGGKGNDILLGGIGDDTYIYTTGDGLDTIYDQGNQGLIKVDGTTLHGGKQYGDNRVYQDKANHHLYVQVDDKTLVIDGNIIVNNYTRGSNALGLNMTGPEPEIIVNIQPIQTINFNDGAGDGNISDTPYSDRITAVNGDYHLVRDGGDNDIINFGTGDDDLWTTDSGAISGVLHANGGAGRDYLGGGNKNDVLEGGEGADDLYGAGGDDLMYGDVKGNTQDLITQGSTQAGTGLQGDVFDAEDGDDKVFGGASNDLIAGGDGDDLLVGGGGGDLIYGDRNTYSNGREWLNWSVTKHIELDAAGNKIYSYDVTNVHTESNSGTGNDVIYAGAGNDTASGESGNDVLFGEAGKDELWGDDGNDILLGGDDDDLLIGDGVYASSPGNDYLDGGKGNDEVYGGAGDDVLIGGKDNDILSGGAGDDTYIFNKGDGIDTVYDKKSERNIIRFGEGVNSSDIKLHLGSLLLDMGDGDEIHIGNFDSQDVFNSSSITTFEFADGITLSIDELLSRGFDIDGTSQADNILGTNTLDRINGLAGNDSLFGSFGTDSISGGDGDDIIDGGGDEDTLLGGSGNDSVFGALGTDSIYGGDGDDYLAGDNGNGEDSIGDDDYLEGGIGNDILYGQGGNDSLFGGVGSDQLVGAGGDDTYYLNNGDGQDLILDSAGVNTIVFGAGITINNVVVQYDLSTDGLIIKYGTGSNPSSVTLYSKLTDGYITGGFSDQIIQRYKFADGSEYTHAQLLNLTANVLGYGGTTENDNIVGGRSGDYLGGGAGNDTIMGQSGNDSLYGDIGDDSLLGGLGSDTLSGGDGRDTLIGGVGNDSLQGGAGADVYIFSKGDGIDRIAESDSDPSNLDAVKFLDIKSADALSLGKDGNNLIIQYGVADQIIVLNHFNPSNLYNIEQIIFSDNVVWNSTGVDIKYGSSSNDSIVGGSSNNHIQGFQGNDTLVGQGQADTLNGGDGSDTLYGNDGADVLIGGRGSDYVDGGRGNDLYVFYKGDGVDLLADNDTLAGNIDTVQFMDVASTEVSLSASQYFLNFNYGNGDQLQVYWQFDYYDNKYFIEEYKFSDGVVWTRADIAQQYVIQTGTSAADALSANDLVDVMDGGLGNDSLWGTSGDQIIIGGKGNDNLRGGEGLDTYIFSKGDGIDLVDTITVNNAGPRDKIVFTDVNSSEITSLIKSTQNLIINYGFSDQITVNNQFFWDTNQMVSIEFADHVVWDSTYSSAVLIQYAATDYHSYDNFLHGWANKDSIIGGDNVDQMMGLEGDDTLIGHGGNDYLSGGDGNDIINGGAGDDQLYGGYGSDYYVFSDGDGADWLADFGEISDTDYDIVDFLDIASTDVTFLRYGDALVIKYGSSGELSISGQLSSSPYYSRNIDEFRFSDGVVLLAADIPSRVVDSPGDDYFFGTDLDDFLEGGSGNDTLIGGIGHDVLSGGQGVDELYGDNGDDTLEGGQGNDVLRGGAGRNVYLFNIDDGQDTVDGYGAGGNDTLRFGAGISPDDITFAKDGFDLVLIVNGNDHVILKYWQYGARFEYVEFADGTVWDRALLESYVNPPTSTVILGTSGDDYLLAPDSNSYYIEGFEGNDQLNGASGKDTLVGDTGNDTLSGNDGQNVYIFNLGDGQDWVISTSTNDTLKFGAEINVVDIVLSQEDGDLVFSISGSDDRVTLASWESGARFEYVEFADGTVWDRALLESYVNPSTSTLILGTSGHDSLSAPDNNHYYLEGFEGNDQLNGAVGNDTLVGDSGDDTLSGNDGQNVYIFNLGDGQDRVISTSTNDTLRFGADINVADIVLSQEDGDLVFSISGSDDRVTLASWENGARFEYVEFADGTVWDRALLESYVNPSTSTVILGTSGDDLLQVPSNNYDAHHLIGLDGNDILYGGSGGSASDTLEGGRGNDTLVGNLGSDVILFNRGDDQDYIYPSENASSFLFSGGDILRFGADILPDDIELTLSNSGFVLKIKGTDDQVTVGSWISYYSGNIHRIAQVEFADGTIWDYATLEAMAALAPAVYGTGDDFEYGTEIDDYLQGIAGNDSLYGNEGNDTLEGGVGNDELIGDKGDDVYIFNRGDGQDSILNYTSSLDEIDTLRFGIGIVANDIELSKVDGNITFAIKGSNDQVTIISWDSGYQIQQVEFIDGTVWDSAVLDTLIANIGTTPTNLPTFIEGSIDDDLLNGTSSNDSISGGAGSDSLYGGAGNDTLTGGTGNDFLYDSEGSDTFVAGVGFGFDAIEVHHGTSSEVKTLLLEGLNKEDINLARWGDALGIGFDKGNGWEGVSLNNFFASANTRVDIIQFANGETWNYTDIMAQTMNLTGTSLNDVLYGFQNSPNAIYGGEGNDLIIGGQINDGLRGEAGNDIMQAGAGTDFFIDNTGNNVADGGAGTDSLMLGSGNDFIAGGKGYDFINTGAGNDIIAFNKGDGSDVVYASTGADNTLSLGGNFSYNDLVFAKSGNSLILGLGSGDQISFDDWYTSNANHSVINLQVIAEAMTDFDTNGSNTLLDDNIETFDFAGLVDAFDTARAADSNLTNWQLSNALLDFHLGGSDTSAIGGDLAYQYGVTGSLTGIGLTAAQNVINATGFGQSVQGLNASSTWQNETVKLS
ncbi:MAG: calcium-binding protein [Methylophilaceae bacterium]